MHNIYSLSFFLRGAGGGGGERGVEGGYCTYIHIYLYSNLYLSLYIQGKQFYIYRYTFSCNAGGGGGVEREWRVGR